MTQSKARANLWNHINGATGAQILSAGGTMGTAKIEFTAQVTEGDYITVTDANGNATVFTFYDTGNLPGVDSTIEIDKGANLAAALAAAETKIQAHGTVGAVPGGSGIIANVDVTDTDTDLDFQIYPHLAGVTITSSTDGANTADTAVTDGSVVYVNPVKSKVLLTWADATPNLTYLTLPNGTYDGQVLEFYCVSEAAAADTIGVLADYGSTNNTITITGAAGDGVSLYWNSGQWNIEKATNATASATTALAL